MVLYLFLSLIQVSGLLSCLQETFSPGAPSCSDNLCSLHSRDGNEGGCSVLTEGYQWSGLSPWMYFNLGTAGGRSLCIPWECRVVCLPEQNCPNSCGKTQCHQWGLEQVEVSLQILPSEAKLLFRMCLQFSGLTSPIVVHPTPSVVLIPKIGFSVLEIPQMYCSFT